MWQLYIFYTKGYLKSHIFIGNNQLRKTLSWIIYTYLEQQNQLSFYKVSYQTRAINNIVTYTGSKVV